MMTRQEFLKRAGGGFGFAALQGLLAAQSPTPGTHHTPKAKRVIFLFMQGGPSQMDLFDYKPQLEQRHSQPFSLALPKNYEAPGIRGTRFFGPIGKFVRQGQRGMLMSDMLPQLGSVVDDLCLSS